MIFLAWELRTLFTQLNYAICKVYLSDFSLDSLLAANDPICQNIPLVILKTKEMQDVIITNKVNAISAWNYPLTQTNRQLETDEYDRKIFTGLFNIASQQDFVQKNIWTVKRPLCTLIKVQDFKAKNPNEMQDIIFTTIKKLIRDVWGAFNYQVVRDQTVLITLKDEIRWAQINKLIDRTVMPDYLNFIHLGSLNTVNPEAFRMGR
jgi:NitT/TauT family transport system substrate-binding protein